MVNMDTRAAAKVLSCSQDFEKITVIAPAGSALMVTVTAATMPLAPAVHSAARTPRGSESTAVSKIAKYSC